MFIVIAGVVVVVGGAALITLGIQAILKLIQKEYKLDKAIKEMNGEDPYKALYESDNLYTCVERDHLKEVIAREEAARYQRGFLGKVRDFFSREKKESSVLVKEVYKVKKEAIEFDNSSSEIGTLEKTINQEHLSKAKSAYRILKSQHGREQYQKSLVKKPLRVSKQVVSDTEKSETMNTSKNKRTHGYEFKVKMSGIERFLTFFKSSKQYQPKASFKARLKQTR